MARKPLYDIEVFHDYGCPFSYETSIWLRDLQQILGDKLRVHWRYFPIEQVNSDKGPDWKVWEQPLDLTNRIQSGFRAAVAASEQGPEAFNAFHFAWLEARHAMKPGVRPPSIHDVVKKIGLDMDRFERDFNDPKLWAKIGEDYEYGIREHAVFGTPTIVFPDGQAAYVKVRPAPGPEDALKVWKEVTNIIANRPNVYEIKRPWKP